MSPWVFSRRIEDGFDLPKFVVLLAACSLALPELLKPGACRWAAALVRGRPWALAALLWGMSAAASVAWSPFREAGLLKLGALALCAIVFLYSAAASAARLRAGSFAVVLAAGGALQSAYALLQWRGIDPVFGDVTGGFAGASITTKIIGTLGYQNTLGAYLALLAPVCAFGAARSRGWREAAPWAASGAAVCVVILLARSRAAWVAAILGIAVFAIAYPSASPGKAGWRRVAAVIVAAGALLAALSWMTRGDRRMSVGSRLSSAVSLSSPAVRQRLLIWKATGEMIRSRPLRGHGLGSFAMEYLGVLGELRRRPENAWLKGSAVNVKESHNDYLQMWAEIGAVGVALWLAFSAAAARALFRAARDAGLPADSRRWCAAVLGVLAGFLSLGATSFPLQILPVAPIFWMLLGTGLGAACGRGAGGRLTASPPSIGGRIALGGTVLAGAALCAVLLWSSRLFLVARACADRGRPDISALLCRRALRLTPWNGQLRAYYGACLLALGDARGALAELRRSTATWADVNLWRSLGNACARTGNTGEAIAWFERARRTGIEPDAVKLDYGALLLSLKDPRGETLLRSLAAFPRPNIDAALLLARHYMGEGSPAQAAALLRPLSGKTAPQLLAVSRRYAMAPAKLAEAMELLGTALLAQGDAALAERCLESSIALNPGSLATRNNLATSLQMQGRRAEALRIWRDVLAVDPGNATARFNIRAAGAR